MKRATVQKQKKLLSGVFSRCTAFRNSYVAAKGHRTLCRLWYRTGDCHQCGKKRWLQKLLKFLAYPFKPSLASVYVTRKFKTTKLRNNDDRNIRRLVDAVLDRCSTTLMYDRSSEFREIAMTFPPIRARSYEILAKIKRGPIEWINGTRGEGVSGFRGNSWS